MDETHASKPPEAVDMPDRPPEGLRTYLDDAEKGWREHIVSCYGKYMSEKQIETVKHMPVALESSEEFAENFRGQTGVLPEAGVVGFYDGHAAHVLESSDTDIVETMGHELLHAAGPNETDSRLPREVEEGLVERRTQQAMGRENLREQGDMVAYVEGQRIVESVDIVCGPESMNRAYFRGDSNDLQLSLRNALEVRSKEPEE